MSKADLHRDQRMFWLCRTCGQWSTDSDRPPETHTLSVSESQVPGDLEWVEYPTQPHPFWKDQSSTFFRADAPPLAWTMLMQEWSDGKVRRHYSKICGDYEPWVARRQGDT